jgi:hypothetical protein
VKVAIVCPGPSLPRVWRPWSADCYDLVVAVNRALLVVPDADWLSAGDEVVFRRLLPGVRPRIGVITMTATIPEVRDLPAWRGLKWIGWKDVPLIEEHQRRGRPLAWSVQAALCLAAAKGAAAVDLYGADGIAGGQVEDCTGHPGDDRTLERWKREELDLALSTDLLAELGVAVTRIPIPPPDTTGATPP